LYVEIRSNFAPNKSGFCADITQCVTERFSFTMLYINVSQTSLPCYYGRRRWAWLVARDSART